MNMAAFVAIVIAIFVYIELAVGVGCYMFFLASKKATEAEGTQWNQIRKYSIIAGAIFPVTIAIIIAHKAAERG